MTAFVKDTAVTDRLGVILRTSVPAVGSAAVAVISVDGVVVAASAVGELVRYADASGTLLPERPPARRDSIFDLASLTKLFTTVVVLSLVEEGRLELDAPVATYLPAYAERPGTTLRHLLTHTAGLPSGHRLEGRFPGWGPAVLAARMESVLSTPVVSPVGDSHVYSDVGMIILGRVAELVGGASLDVLVRERVTAPLGLADTGYRPRAVHHGLALRTGVSAGGVEHRSAAGHSGMIVGGAEHRSAGAASKTGGATHRLSAGFDDPGHRLGLGFDDPGHRLGASLDDPGHRLGLGFDDPGHRLGAGPDDPGHRLAPLSRIAATEDKPERPGPGCVRGDVHDETAFSLGGVAGHAGMFATADDVLRLGEALRLGGGPLLRPDTVAEMTRDQGAEGSSFRQGLGVRLGDPAIVGPLTGAFGHSGFTGTSVVVDPVRGLTVVLLTNAVHPARGKAGIRALRHAVATEALRLA